MRKLLHKFLSLFKKKEERPSMCLYIRLACSDCSDTIKFWVKNKPEMIVGVHFSYPIMKLRPSCTHCCYSFIQQVRKLKQICELEDEILAFRIFKAENQMKGYGLKDTLHERFINFLREEDNYENEGE